MEFHTFHPGQPAFLYPPCVIDRQLFRSLWQSFLSSWLTLAICKFTIVTVSAYDIYLTVKYVDSLPTMELNPIGRWLMSLNPAQACELEQIALFLTIKFAGNIATLSILEGLCRWKLSMANAVALGVAAFQLVLLYLLAFHD